MEVRGAPDSVIEVINKVLTGDEIPSEQKANLLKP